MILNKKPVQIAIALLTILIISLVYVEHHTAKPSFCGTSCHIMKKYYTSWESSKHRTVACVDCHYAPGEKTTIKAKLKGLSQLFSYLATNDKEVKKRALIQDESCLMSGCHNKKEYISKDIKYTEKVSFLHITHDDTLIEGQKMHCSTCHVHTTSEKHFEVPKKVCYLCHFKNQKFNEGRGKCDICHEIPTKSLQKKDQQKDDVEPITHELLKKNKVGCESCHFELIKGEGPIKQENCMECHDNKEDIDKFSNKKLMHEKHVAGQTANCFNCHSPIEHKSTQFVDPIIKKCSNCHPDHHDNQKKLLLASIKDKAEKAPALMFNVKTNCLGCHTEKGIDKKGEVIFNASNKACINCHTKRLEGMLDDWKKKLKELTIEADEIKLEAITKLKQNKTKINDDKMKEFNELLNNGKYYLNIVKNGNGIHNQKFSIVLIDKAVDNFFKIIDTIDEL